MLLSGITESNRNAFQNHCDPYSLHLSLIHKTIGVVPDFHSSSLVSLGLGSKKGRKRASFFSLRQGIIRIITKGWGNNLWLKAKKTRVVS